MEVRHKLGVIHNVLASILKWILVFPMFLINSLCALCKGEFNDYADKLAYTKDLYGNILMCYVFNFIFINKASTNKYGVVVDDKYVTISHVTAANYYAGTLTMVGRFFAKILIFFNDQSFNKQNDAK